MSSFRTRIRPRTNSARRCFLFFATSARSAPMSANLGAASAEYCPEDARGAFGRWPRGAHLERFDLRDIADRHWRAKARSPASRGFASTDSAIGAPAGRPRSWMANTSPALAQKGLALINDLARGCLRYSRNSLWPSFLDTSRLPPGCPESARHDRHPESSVNGVSGGAPPTNYSPPSGWRVFKVAPSDLRVAQCRSSRRRSQSCCRVMLLRASARPCRGCS